MTDANYMLKDADKEDLSFREITFEENVDYFIRRSSKRDEDRKQAVNNLYLDNSHISKDHACLRMIKGRLCIKDCGSTFGTTINDNFIVSGMWHELSPEETIGFVISKPSSRIAEVIKKHPNDSYIPISEFSFPEPQVKVLMLFALDKNVARFYISDEPSSKENKGEENEAEEWPTEREQTCPCETEGGDDFGDTILEEEVGIVCKESPSLAENELSNITDAHNSCSCISQATADDITLLNRTGSEDVLDPMDSSEEILSIKFENDLEANDDLVCEDSLDGSELSSSSSSDDDDVWNSDSELAYLVKCRPHCEDELIFSDFEIEDLVDFSCDGAVMKSCHHSSDLSDHKPLKKRSFDEYCSDSIADDEFTHISPVVNKKLKVAPENKGSSKIKTIAAEVCKAAFYIGATIAALGVYGSTLEHNNL